ncbi:dnaJ homolog subfamily B member 13-like [Limanda limanda]|uniref:dnaJ homolog subfamily B member 13-like n=1 Tax=Limanda limanda TaxID=27771 RepID=UPI0029C6B628|nr:dnaJ homolog subfamily B member 13-like [Limanda limanda]
MDEDYYKTLEINKSAIAADIKKAYRCLALKFHPNSTKEAGSADRFSQLGEAYDVLSDPRKKATYDRFGLEGLKGGIPPEFGKGGAWSSKYAYHGEPEDTFIEFFGCDNPFAVFSENDVPLQFVGLQPVVVKTQDPPVEKDLELSLDELFLGCTKKIKIYRNVMNEAGLSSVKDKILSIDVNPGWKEGTRIVFSKEGDQLGPNSIPADIVFIVRQKPHPLFERQGDDLINQTLISLEMALTGFSVNVRTIDGRLIDIPINDIVHTRYRKVVPGEGMPLFQDPSQRGDLIIHFDIQFPEKLSADRKHLIKKALK